jgi:FkbM family methyltransferase
MIRLDTASLEALGPAGRHYVNEAFTRLVYVRTLRAGDTALDVGANAGDHTRELAAVVGPTGLVHAFEPNVVHYPGLLAIAHQVRLWPLAAGARLSVEHLSIPEGLDGWASLGSLTELLPGRAMRTLTVVQAPLDELDLPVHGRLGFAKVDVEGHEFQVLQGASKLLRRHRPLLVVENVTAEAAALAQAEGYGAFDFLGTPLAAGRQCLSGAACLPNTLLVPQGWAGPSPFLVTEARDVQAVLAQAATLGRA